MAVTRIGEKANNAIPMSANMTGRRCIYINILIESCESVCIGAGAQASNPLG